LKLLKIFSKKKDNSYYPELSLLPTNRVSQQRSRHIYKPEVISLKNQTRISQSEFGNFAKWQLQKLINSPSSECYASWVIELKSMKQFYIKRNEKISFFILNFTKAEAFGNLRYIRYIICQ